jgi:hypothetical protein
MAEILKEGLLAWEPNPVDERGKLIWCADVEALAAKREKASRQRRIDHDEG